MTTNGEWLFSKPFEEQVAWMNAEHQELGLDGDTDALEAKQAICTVTVDYDDLRDKLFEELQRDYVVMTSEEYDELTAERDNWKEHSRTIEYRCKKAETDCEIYRKKFGMCIDYADAIHALMDDEGMA